MRNKFRKPMSLVVWVVIDYAGNKYKTDAFVGALSNCFHNLGEFYLRVRFNLCS